ncbi:MAG: chaperone protein DnaJ [Pseudomonadota bacterium]|jgi:DnaJ-class molecular chaperone
MGANKNFYQTLGLLNNVDDVVIKAAYRALAQKHHPDKFKTNKELHTQKMAQLNEAFAAIGTKAKRKAYDESLRVSTAKQEKKAAADVHAPNQELIEKLEQSAMDEMVVVALFEKVFSQTIQINSGWVNTYSFKNGKQKVTVNFTELKLKIIEKLKQ